MACVRCEHLCKEIPVRSAAELEAFVASIQKEVTSGTLKELKLPFQNKKPLGRGFFILAKLWPSAARRIISNSHRASLAQLTGPTWPDDFECRLKCVHCRAQFALEVNVYHGRGGAWHPLT
jgi:hypothetical protein